MSDILAEASRLRSGIPCSFADEKTRSGSSHMISKIVFEDSVTWAARTVLDTSNWKDNPRVLECFKHVKDQCPEIKAPQVYFRDVDHVIFFEWVSGRELAVWNSLIPMGSRQRLLDGLAEFLFQLWSVPAPTSQSAPTATMAPTLYSEWLRDSLDRGLNRTLAGTARWGHAIDYLIMRSMIPKYAEQFDAYSRLGFAHGDLNANNIMMSPDYGLTGVVDWDWMHLAPLPAVIHHPWFIADIPGWHNNGVVDGDSFAEDRFFLEDAVKRRELSQKQPAHLSSLLAASGERFFFQTAFHFKDIHESFVRLHCGRTRHNVAAAKLELVNFLSCYPYLKSMEESRRVEDLLDSLY